ncbi:MAG TPA: hypothetical protein VKU01_23585 [Bryobacteraceae bacterium]|nr:hypothetical protein [Bryobacteraceae bacterium]
MTGTTQIVYTDRAELAHYIAWQSLGNAQVSTFAWLRKVFSDEQLRERQAIYGVRQNEIAAMQPVNIPVILMEE